MGGFQCALSEVDSLNIIKPKPDPQTGKIEQLHIILPHYREGKLYTTTLTLTKDGELSGELPLF